eukprot:7490766-Pyramimonas_sp.AAC.1
MFQRSQRGRGVILASPIDRPLAARGVGQRALLLSHSRSTSALTGRVGSFVLRSIRGVRVAGAIEMFRSHVTPGL